MPSIWPTIGSALGYVFKPQLKSPRILDERPTPSNLGLLAIVSAVIILLAAVLTGQTVNLYLPHYFDWQWVDVTIVRFPVWVWLLFWVLAAGLCLVPRITAITIGVVFSLYYLYASVNGATADATESGSSRWLSMVRSAGSGALRTPAEGSDTWSTSA